MESRPTLTSSGSSATVKWMLLHTLSDVFDFSLLFFFAATLLVETVALISPSPPLVRARCRELRREIRPSFVAPKPKTARPSGLLVPLLLPTVFHSMLRTDALARPVPWTHAPAAMEASANDSSLR